MQQDGLFVKQYKNPMVNFSIFKKGEQHPITSKFYIDQAHNAIIIKNSPENQSYKIRVQYRWFYSPHKDYTVKLHSKHTGVKITNEKGETNQLHTDG